MQQPKQWYYSDEVMKQSAINLCTLRKLDPYSKVKINNQWVFQWEHLIDEIVKHCDVEIAVNSARNDYQNRLHRLVDDE